MLVQVKLFRFGNGKSRTVQIPSISGTKNEILEEVFHYGQNHNQPQDLPSISAGDVILIGGERHLVKGFGFEQVSDEDFEIMEKASKIENEGPEDLKHRYDMVLFDLIGERSFKLLK